MFPIVGFVHRYIHIYICTVESASSSFIDMNCVECHHSIPICLVTNLGLQNCNALCSCTCKLNIVECPPEMVRSVSIVRSNKIMLFSLAFECWYFCCCNCIIYLYDIPHPYFGLSHWCNSMNCKSCTCHPNFTFKYLH